MEEGRYGHQVFHSPPQNLSTSHLKVLTLGIEDQYAVICLTSVKLSHCMGLYFSILKQGEGSCTCQVHLLKNALICETKQVCKGKDLFHIEF